MIMERIGRRARFDGSARMAADGMPLAADGRRLDELLWRKMDMTLGSPADRDSRIDALDEAIESADIRAGSASAYFGARAAREGGLSVGMRNARDCALGDMEGAAVQWSGEDFMARGLAPGRFGAIAAIMGAEAWRAMESRMDFIPAAFPEISMSVEDGYEFAAREGAERREGLLPMRTVSANAVVRRDGRAYDWRRSGEEIRRLIRRKLIDGIYRSILWDDFGEGAALLARSAEGDLTGGGLELSRIAIEICEPFDRTNAKTLAAMEGWGNVDAGDLMAICHWSDKEMVEARLGMETFAPRVVSRGLGNESEDICAVVYPRGAFRFGLRSLPWIWLMDEGGGAIAAGASVSIGFGAAAKGVGA